MYYHVFVLLLFYCLCCGTQVPLFPSTCINLLAAMLNAADDLTTTTASTSQDGQSLGWKSAKTVGKKPVIITMNRGHFEMILMFLGARSLPGTARRSRSNSSFLQPSPETYVRPGVLLKGLFADVCTFKR